MTGLLAAETLKVVKRRMYWIMLAILAAIVALTAVIFLVVLPGVPAAAGAPPLPLVTKPDAYGFGASQVLGQTWFPAILAAVLLAGEMSTSVWASALTREARRWMHLLVKGAVLTGASWVASLAGLAVWSLITVFVAEGSGVPDAGVWARILLTTLLVDATWVAIGLGGTALFRALGPALVVVLGLSFLDGILTFWEPWREVSLGQAAGRLSEEFGAAAAFGAPMTSMMGSGQALAVLLGWAVLGAGVAALGLHRDP